MTVGKAQQLLNGIAFISTQVYIIFLLIGLDNIGISLLHRSFTVGQIVQLTADLKIKDISVHNAGLLICQPTVNFLKFFLMIPIEIHGKEVVTCHGNIRSIKFMLFCDVVDHFGCWLIMDGESHENNEVAEFFLHIRQMLHREPLKGMSADKTIAGKDTSQRNVVAFHDTHDFQCTVAHAIDDHRLFGFLQMSPEILLFLHQFKMFCHRYSPSLTIRSAPVLLIFSARIIPADTGPSTLTRLRASVTL